MGWWANFKSFWKQAWTAAQERQRIKLEAKRAADDERALREAAEASKLFKGGKQETDGPYPYGPGWDELPSSEKIKLVQVRPLRWRSGEVLDAGSKSTKRFRIRVVIQKPGVFEMDEDNAITVNVIARGREAAMNVVTHGHCGHHAYTDAKFTKGDSGRWYDGTKIELEILAAETIRDPITL